MHLIIWQRELVENHLKTSNQNEQEKEKIRTERKKEIDNIIKDRVSFYLKSDEYILYIKNYIKQFYDGTMIDIIAVERVGKLMVVIINKYIDDTEDIDELRQLGISFNLLIELFKQNYEKLSHPIIANILWISLRQVSFQIYSDEYVRQYGDQYNNLGVLEIIEQFVYDNALEGAYNERYSSLLAYYLVNKGKSDSNLFETHKIINNMLVERIQTKRKEDQLNNFQSKLHNITPKVIANIADVDIMNGQEFEVFISGVFKKMGYSCNITKYSGDQGIDIIAIKNDIKVGIQTKCYNGKVTNKAVQEVVAGLRYYSCEKGIVITNSYFTTSAIELAQTNNIDLWDRDMLKRKIDELNYKI